MEVRLAQALEYCLPRLVEAVEELSRKVELREELRELRGAETHDCIKSRPPYISLIPLKGL